ncbi:MAG TPA: hypothetical protein ENI94_13110 [Gammaproteobacteria bacterium]|nr:hypothetical protein [Gammaproteobacteria bacterium]
MPSLFSMFHRQPVPPPHEDITRQPAATDPLLAPLSLVANSAPSPGQILSNMLDILHHYLPSSGPSVPTPSLSTVSVRQRPVGIGNWRGTERRGSLAEISLKGGRLDIVVRFQLWADTVSSADNIVSILHNDLLTNSGQLRVDGFLRLELTATSPAEFIGGSINAWRKITDYKILYEYHYHDLDGAESIIARIPIHRDPEQRDSLERETTLVTDKLIRWDDLQAPSLDISATVKNKIHIDGLASLAHHPSSWPGNSVTVARLQRNISTPPTTYSTLAEFHAAVTREVNPDLHAQIIFPSLADFLLTFDSAGDAFGLGDWDENGTLDTYQPGTLKFDPPLILDGSNDLLRVSYPDMAFDSKAVVYLRASVH